MFAFLVLGRGISGMVYANEISANVSLEKNDKYNDISQDKITVNSKYCLITITSDKPVYYNYLSLSEKKYTVKSTKLKTAELIDGKYVIDYSDCNPLKSYCIGIGTRNEDYIVDGFSYEYKDELTYVVKSKKGEKVKGFKGNKYYKCKGSTFDYIYQIDAYYASEVDTVSCVKFDANHKDTASGTDLIMSAKVKCAQDTVSRVEDDMIDKSRYYVNKEAKIAGNKNVSVCVKKKSWTYPYGAIYTCDRRYSDSYYGIGSPRYCVENIYLNHFPYDFIWREKGQKTWLDSNAFTGEKLKEYLKKGITLEMRFSVVHDYRTNAVGKTGKELYEGIYGDRFGKAKKVVIKQAKIAKAPNVKLDLAKQAVTLKNGMQFSFDKKHWISIYPYYKKAYKFGRTIDSLPSLTGRNFACAECNNDYDCLKDGQKVAKITRYKWSFVYLENLNACFCNPAVNEYYEVGVTPAPTLYVRFLAKANGLPSQIAEVKLPTIRYAAPKVALEESEKGLIVKNINQGENDIVVNPQYEYCIINRKLTEKMVNESLKKKDKNKNGFWELGRGYGDREKWLPCFNGTLLQPTSLTYSDNRFWKLHANKASIVKVSVKVPIVVGSYIVIRRKEAPKSGLVLPSYCSCFEIMEDGTVEFTSDRFFSTIEIANIGGDL